LDLTDRLAVEAFFKEEGPDQVYLAAAKVGGIHANATYPADFIFSNLAIQTNVIDAAFRNGVERLIFLGSSCIYPRDCPQPIAEEHLLSGPLEETNRAYAIAKIAGVEMCRAYNRQHATRFLAVMPTNLYGLNDNYDLANSHVLPALIRKMHEAKLTGATEVVVWGTGRPFREFLHSDDLADACAFLMNLPGERYSDLLNNVKAPALINIGSGKDQSIHDVALIVQEVIGYEGRLVFDTSRPDGTPRKLLDVSRMQALGWRAAIDLRTGIASTYADFLKRQECST
jgi:GDP-L-fucose synthase